MAARRRRLPHNRLSVEIQGDDGASFVRLGTTDLSGVVHLRVADAGIVTIDEEIPVATLAAVLSHARRIGWDDMLALYGRRPIRKE